jgi:hypothetical protein
MSTMASSARILVISRDQKPLGKYDISNRRLMEHSGSDRWVISHWNAAVASTPSSVGILGPVYNKMVFLNSFILTVLVNSYCGVQICC